MNPDIKSYPMTKTLLAFGLVCFIGLGLIWVLWTFYQEPKQTVFLKILLGVLLGIFFGCVYFCRYLLKVRKSRIEISPKGISRVGGDGTSQSLNWNEIANISENRQWQQIVLANQEKTTKVVIDYQFKDFDEIREKVFDELEANLKLPPLPIVFIRKSNGFYLFCLIILSILILFFSFFFFYTHEYFIGGFSSLFALLPIAFFYSDKKLTNKLSVESNGINIVTNAENKQLSYSNIREITWKYVMNRNGDKFSLIELATKEDEVFKLTYSLGPMPEIYLILRKLIHISGRPDAK